MLTGAEYRFHCPECAADITVNEEMLEALCSTGCVICGATVTRGDFEALTR